MSLNLFSWISSLVVTALGLWLCAADKWKSLFSTGILDRRSWPEIFLFAGGVFLVLLIWFFIFVIIRMVFFYRQPITLIQDGGSIIFERRGKKVIIRGLLEDWCGRLRHFTVWDFFFRKFGYLPIETTINREIKVKLTDKASLILRVKGLKFIFRDRYSQQDIWQFQKEYQDAATLQEKMENVVVAVLHGVFNENVEISCDKTIIADNIPIRFWWKLKFALEKEPVYFIIGDKYSFTTQFEYF
jgi:hypothetical protein